MTGRIVLSIGDAVAFAAFGVADDSSARDLAATDILTRHAGRPVSVQRRPSGRPCLLPPWPELGISLSHRGGALLIGFSPLHPVGVDIEIVDETLEIMRLARDHFAAGEKEALATLPGADRANLFFRLWCGKEAVLKATGRGIADGMLEPDFSPGIPSLLRDGATIVCTIGTRRASAAVCTLQDEQGRPHIAALAILD